MWSETGAETKAGPSMVQTDGAGGRGLYIVGRLRQDLGSIVHFGLEA